MQIAKINIAAGVVGVVMTLLMMAFIANGVGQFRKTGCYEIPNDLIDFGKIVLPISLGCLTLGSIQAGRKTIEKKDAENNSEPG